MAKTFDWKEIQDYYDLGHTLYQTRIKFGIGGDRIIKAKRDGDIIPRPNGSEIETLLVENYQGRRANIKRRIISLKLIPYTCSSCGLGDHWNGKRIVLVLDHMNGVSNDYRLTNLRFLCPNCNSQEETFAGRNKGKTTVGRSR